MTHQNLFTSSSLDPELHRLFVLGIRAGMWGMFGAIPVGIWWLAQHDNPILAVLWGLLTGLTTLASQLILYRLEQQEQTRHSFKRLEKYYALKAAGNGLSWGLLALVINDSTNAGDVFALLMMYFTFLVVSCVTLCMSRIGYPCFALGLVSIFLYKLYIYPPAPLLLTGVGVLIGVGVLLFVHHSLFLTLQSFLERRRQRDTLAQEQEAVFQAASEGIVLLRKNRIVKSNQCANLMLTDSTNALQDTTFKQWLNKPHEWRNEHPRMLACFATNQAWRHVTQLRTQQQQLVDVELSANPLDPQNPIAGIVLIITDITERLRGEASLRNSEQRFRRLLSQSFDWYWEQDADLRFTHISGEHADSTQRMMQTFLGKQRWEVAQIESNPQLWLEHRAALQAQQPFNDFIYAVQMEGQEARWMSSNGLPVHDQDGNFCGYHGTSVDVTDKIQEAAHYQHLAKHDTLTGLANRRLLDDRFESARTQAKRNQSHVALLMLDLDGFKSINDTAGHEVGDLVLIQVAERLRKCVRESDCVCRFGGDEFIILLQNLHHGDDAAIVAEKVLEALGPAIQHSAQSWQVGVSIGIAHLSPQNNDLDALIAQADSAMYRAKHSGGHHWQQARKA